MGRRAPHPLTPRERAVVVGGGEVVVHVWGDDAAPPVLLWHGVGDDGLHLSPVAELLAGDFGYRALAPDAPGFGRSQPLPRGASCHPGALGRLALRLLAEFGVERCPFVGHSWGAGIGCHAAAHPSGRVTALALLDGGYTEAEDWEELDELAGATEDEWITIGREQGIADPEPWARAVRAAIEPPTVASLYPELRRARVPVLLLAADHSGGADGGRAAASGLARFRASLPEAEIRVLDGVGHDLPGEAADAVARIVGEWLQSSLVSAERVDRSTQTDAPA